MSSLILTVLALTIRADSRLEVPDNPIDRRAVRGSAVITVLFAAALPGGVLVTGLNYWELLLLLLAWPIERVLDRRTVRRA